MSEGTLTRCVPRGASHVGDIGRLVTVTSHGRQRCRELAARDLELVIVHQVDLGRPPAADHVALGSAVLGRGAADTASAA
ncbi:hypothetical protein DFH08DRAFT_952228 [Mycena albidolilacea]|uniref:Uncharacterized protein n=1 Tax=Mycena albidolilacea TaxID=1033008 RepID=A0AAD7F2T8_9AGAR|nr:hypothetical protein DFH08DRAFT_952228 [Mycena albidolilacea]